MGHKTLTRSIE